MNITKKSVRIVDDDTMSRHIFDKYLTSMGFETVLADNGEEAMEILANAPYFDLIITDVMMPYLTGFDFTKKLKEYKETKNIPVIGTSAFHDWKEARKDLDLIVDGFIPKPVKKEVLQSEIKRAMGE